MSHAHIKCFTYIICFILPQLYEVLLLFLFSDEENEVQKITFSQLHSQDLNPDI